MNLNAALIGQYSATFRDIILSCSSVSKSLRGLMCVNTKTIGFHERVGDTEGKNCDKRQYY